MIWDHQHFLKPPYRFWRSCATISVLRSSLVALDSLSSERCLICRWLTYWTGELPMAMVIDHPIVPHLTLSNVSKFPKDHSHITLKWRQSNTVLHILMCICIPEDPCMEYLPTLTPKVIKNNPNVGKYSIHGSYGYIICISSWIPCWLPDAGPGCRMEAHSRWSFEDSGRGSTGMISWRASWQAKPHQHSLDMFAYLENFAF